MEKQICLYEKCQVEFIPKKKGQKFHCLKCSSNHHNDVRKKFYSISREIYSILKSLKKLDKLRPELLDIVNRSFYPEKYIVLDNRSFIEKKYPVTYPSMSNDFRKWERGQI